MQEPIRTDYLSHDAVYRSLKAKGADGWDNEYQARLTLGQVESFLADASLPACPSLLELGCGAGNVSLHFARKGAFGRIVGVDISPCAIEWAREKAHAEGLSAEFFVADVTKELTLSIDPVDLVLDGHCLHCIIGEDRRMFLHNARKNLRPGGLFYVDTMCGDPCHEDFRRNFDPATRCMVHNGIARRYLGLPDQILQELCDAGLEVIKQRLIRAANEHDQDTLLILVRPR